MTFRRGEDRGLPCSSTPKLVPSYIDLGLQSTARLPAIAVYARSTGRQRRGPITAHPPPAFGRLGGRSIHPDIPRPECTASFINRAVAAATGAGGGHSGRPPPWVECDLGFEPESASGATGRARAFVVDSIPYLASVCKDLTHVSSKTWRLRRFIDRSAQ